MTHEDSPARTKKKSDAADNSDGNELPSDDRVFWHELIDEKPAADFLDVKPRTMQKWRQTGEGPEYVRLSARCIRYTRALLRAYAEARIRKSTSDPGEGAA